MGNLLTGSGAHLTHICERWATSRTDGLQYAFFNGAGYEAWENVWGIFNQVTPRQDIGTMSDWVMGEEIFPIQRNYFHPEMALP